MTTRNLKIDLTPGGAPQVIRVSQYDNGARRLLVSLTDGDKGAFTIPEGATVKVDGTKPSGKGFSDACTISGNQVTVTIKDTMTDEPGRVYCELVLTKDSARLGSAKFELDVERGALSPEAIIESDTFEGIIKEAVRECANEQLIELTVDMEPSNESDNPVANKVVSNLFAGALKGLVCGSEVTADDVSPVAHNLKVKAHGKNFCETNELTVAGSQGWKSKFLDEVITLSRGRYTVSADYTQTGAQSWVSVGVRDAADQVTELRVVALNEMSGRLSTSFEITEPAKDIKIVFYSNFTGDKVDTACTFTNIQLERGDTATDYEPWVDPTTLGVTAGGKTFTPDSSGNVEGLTPDMLAGGVSVNNGGIVDCEYNRDLTKVIAKIEAALFN